MRSRRRQPQPRTSHGLISRAWHLTRAASFRLFLLDFLRIASFSSTRLYSSFLSLRFASPPFSFSLFLPSSLSLLHPFLPLSLRSLFPPYFLLPSSLPSYLSSVFIFFRFPFRLRNLIPFNLSMFRKLE